uniref:Uncharacterized protein n=1 Tax=Romanomermis culicivorax TaxID=13658 RepID=A0A915JJI8_ROMCU
IYSETLINLTEKIRVVGGGALRLNLTGGGGGICTKLLLGGILKGRLDNCGGGIALAVGALWPAKTCARVGIGGDGRGGENEGGNPLVVMLLDVVGTKYGNK